MLIKRGNGVNSQPSLCLKTAMYEVPTLYMTMKQKWREHHPLHAFKQTIGCSHHPLYTYKMTMG